MAGRHALGSTTSGPRPRLAGFAGLLVALLALLLIAPNAASAATTDNAQLSLTGPVDGNNPAGGSQLGVHPGDSIKFTASAAPTQKVKDELSKVGAGGLLNTLLGTVKFQVKADFSHFPGGSSKPVTLTDSGSKTFKFSKAGTYSFTYEAQKVTTSINLLGQKISNPPVNIDLKGNQAKQAGVKLNASNQYVATIVVAKKVSGGISIQLPKVNVAPSVPVVGKLPKVSVPGVNIPTVPVSVPNLNVPNANLPKVNIPTGGAKGGTGSTGGNSGGLPLTGGTGALPVPARVVPNGDGNVEYGGTTGGAGANHYAALPGAGSANTGYNALSLGPATGGAANSGATNAAGSGANGQSNTVDLAANKTPTAELPVLLAIIAVIALALVGATYARLFLLRRNAS